MSNTGYGTQPTKQVAELHSHWWTRLVAYSKRKFHERGTKKKEESSADRAARRTANATVWLAVFTVVLALISIGTLLILKNQLREMHEGGIDTHALATATVEMKGSAEKSAQASKDFSTSAGQIDTKIGQAEEDFSRMAENSSAAIAATQEAMHQDQRAWVGFAGDGHINFTMQEGAPLKIRIEFQNFGKTPAFNERGIGQFLTRPIKVPMPSFDTYSIEGASKPITLMPGVITGMNIDTGTPSAEGNVITMDKALIEATNSGTLEIYVYGSQWYDDAFRRHHRSDFCLVFQPRSPAWAACDRHNDAD